MTRRRWILGLVAGATVVALSLVTLLPHLHSSSESHSLATADHSGTAVDGESPRLLGRSESAALRSDAANRGQLTITVRRGGHPVQGVHVCALTRDAWNPQSTRHPMIWAELSAASVARSITDEQGVVHLNAAGAGPFGVIASTDATDIEGCVWRITPGESVTLELPTHRAPLLVSVRTERGTPVEQARIRLLGGDAAGVRFALEGTTGKSGTCALKLPTTPKWRCSVFADHPEFGSAVAYPEELGESITLYLEPGGTVSIRVVDDAMQPLAARISYCLCWDGRIMRRTRAEDLQSELQVVAVPRWATLCVWAVTPDGRFGIEAVEAPQEVVLVLGGMAEVTCSIESPLALHGDGGIWLLPPEARGAWEAIAEWGGDELRDRFLIPLTAQSSPEVLTLPTGLRPRRTFRSQIEKSLFRDWPDLCLDESGRFVSVSRDAKTEAVLNLFQVQETSVAGTVRASQDGAPLAGVLVGSGHFDADVLTHTDASGHYHVAAKRTRPFRLIFRAPGYRMFMSEILEPKPGAHLELDVTLARAGCLRGRVLAADGEGLPEVLVQLLTEAGALLADTTTDSRGWFHIEDAPPGWARIVAELGEHATPWQDQIDIDFEIPATPDPGSVYDVTLRASPGQETATVWGTLRGVSKFGGSGAKIALVLRGRGELSKEAIYATIRSKQYTFEHVPFGDYDICYIVTQGGISIERTITQCEITEHPTKFGLGLPSSGYLHGRVQDVAGAPVGDALLSVVDAQTGVTASAASQVRTDKDGTFALDLMQGRYFVEVVSEGLVGRSEEIRLLPHTVESCTILARRGGSISLQLQVDAVSQVSLAFALEGPTSRNEQGLSVPVHDGAATVPVHGLQAGLYTVQILIGARRHLVEAVEVTPGNTTSVSIQD